MGMTEVLYSTDNTGDEVYVAVPVEENVDKRFECGTCQKTFQLKQSLQRHMKMHEHMASCLTCTQYFKNEEDLKKHNEKKHATKHLCQVCGKLFRRMSALKDHCKLHDNNIKGAVYICTIENCGKGFVRKSKYIDHLNSHINEKPHFCECCSKTFENRYTRNRHYKVCSGHLEVCDICNKSFTDRSSLKRHKDAKHNLKVFRCHCGNEYSYYSCLFKHQKAKDH